jgi:DNA repair protein RecO (recombination protein O)
VSLITSEALLLDVLDLQDRDRIVTFLTREHGKKKGVARGARARHSRFTGQLQPLSKVQITWYEKEGRELGRISSVELVRPAHRLQEDLDGILLGSYLADHLLEFAQENESSDLFFRLLDSTLDALLEGVDRDLAARYFEVWVLRLAGVFPQPHECPSCGRPLEGWVTLPASGETLLCSDCGGYGGLIVRPETLELVRRIGRLSLSTPTELAATPEALRQLEEISARVRRTFLQRELRSYEVIQRTLAQLR